MQTKPDLRPESEPRSPSPQADAPGSQRRYSPRDDQGLSCLGFDHPHPETLASPSETLSNRSVEMTDQVGAGQQTQVDEAAASRDVAEDARSVDAAALAKAALATTETDPRPAAASPQPAKRVDSAQDGLPQTACIKQQPRSGRETPLKLQTGGAVPGSDETIATSPTLAKHALPEAAGTLPALQPTSPTAQGGPTSPKSERLPSIRHFTDIADAAQHEPRVSQYSHHHSQSFGSASAQSPVLPYHIAPSTQMSPSSQYNFSARSPTSAGGEHFTSPTQYPGNAYYLERRASAMHEHRIGMPPSMPSASSSGESHGPAGSSTDGYSTSHTTPIDSAVLSEGMHRNIPILPPPHGMVPTNPALLLSGFKCDYPGCEAAPFGTQYLLSSHKNVHSSARPHYCPVDGCPRGETGKGFKRKNEMIRHGLVHNSPGYICPFCPEREHKYPRPDNLQRHVRVHHAEKDRDDPLLREVLNQRTEGLGKTRRKRANTGPGPC